MSQIEVELSTNSGFRSLTQPQHLSFAENRFIKNSLPTDFIKLQVAMAYLWRNSMNLYLRQDWAFTEQQVRQNRLQIEFVEIHTPASKIDQLIKQHCLIYAGEVEASSIKVTVQQIGFQEKPIYTDRRIFIHCLNQALKAVIHLSGHHDTIEITTKLFEYHIDLSKWCASIVTKVQSSAKASQLEQYLTQNDVLATLQKLSKRMCGSFTLKGYGSVGSLITFKLQCTTHFLGKYEPRVFEYGSEKRLELPYNLDFAEPSRISLHSPSLDNLNV